MGRRARTCIISNMTPVKRGISVSIRLTEAEKKLRDDLAEHLGIDPADVMRQALRVFGRQEGIAIEPKKESDAKD